MSGQPCFTQEKIRNQLIVVEKLLLYQEGQLGRYWLEYRRKYFLGRLLKAQLKEFSRV